MKRRLFDGETEILSLGSMTLTSHRVVLHRRHWWGEQTLAVPLALVEATVASTPRWGLPRVVVHAGRRRLTVSHAEGAACRSMADAIDRAATGRGASDES